MQFANKRMQFMKKFTKKTVFICTLVLQLALLNFLPAEDFYQDIFFMAERLNQSGATEEAATEYKRYLFLQKYSTGIYQTQALDALSRFYFTKGNLNLAIEYNLKAQNYLQNTDETLKLFEIELIKIKSAGEPVTDKNLNNPLTNPRLFSYAKSEKWSKNIRQNAYNAILTVQIHQENWDCVRTEFSEFCKAFPQKFSAEQQNLFYKTLDRAQNQKYKNPYTAMYLSIFPGLGQLYAGNYKDSLNAFLLNSALIGVSFYSLYNLQFQDFILLESSPLLRFYTGNIVNAQKETIDWNKKQTAILQDILTTIINSHLD